MMVMMKTTMIVNMEYDNDEDNDRDSGDDDDDDNGDKDGVGYDHYDDNCDATMLGLL